MPEHTPPEEPPPSSYPLRVGLMYPGAVVPPTPPPLAEIFAEELDALDPAERADAERLARARQEIAAETFSGPIPAWDELDDDDHASLTVQALRYLHAARRAGLLR